MEPYKASLEETCRRLGVKKLYLVGSAAREDFESDRSDIDVVVEFEGNERLFDRYFEFKERLEQSFRRTVDVIQEKAIENPHVRSTIDRDRIVLYGA
jgi:hypothetical protein